MLRQTRDHGNSVLVTAGIAGPRARERITALDSLRGIAALSVVFYHCLLVYPWFFRVLGGQGRNFFRGGGTEVLLLTTMPPSLLWAGREAVLLFFVLSGFVLTLPFISDRAPGYVPFLAKRLCRLFLPSAAVVLGVALVFPIVGNELKPELSDWFNDSSWSEPLSGALVLRHVLLIGSQYSLDGVLWSLHYEWYASLLFPLLVLLSAGGVRLALGAVLLAIVLQRVGIRLTGAPEYGMTLYYLPYFVFGALLARYRMALKEWAATLPRWAGLGLWLLAYVLLKFRWLAPAPSVIFDLANGAGAALVIALVFVSPAAQALLMRRPLTWLGDISYSLYLVHVPVIVVIVRAMPETLPLPAKLMLAPAVSLALATLLFRIVERPSIQLGNLLASRLAGHDLARCGVDFGTAQPGSLAFDHYPADMSEQRWEHNGREVWKRVRFIINPTDAAIHQFGAS